MRKAIDWLQLSLHEPLIFIFECFTCNFLVNRTSSLKTDRRILTRCILPDNSWSENLHKHLGLKSPNCLYQLRHENLQPLSFQLRHDFMKPLPFHLRHENAGLQLAQPSAVQLSNLSLLLNQINFINENLLGASWIFIYEKSNRQLVHSSCQIQ